MRGFATSRAAGEQGSADDDLANASLFEDVGQSLAMIALQHEAFAFDAAAATERGLERLEPGVELSRRKAELLDNGRLFSTASRAFHPDNRSSGSASAPVRWCLGSR